MPTNDKDSFEQVIHKLDRLASLEEADREAMRSLPFSTHIAPPHHHLLRQGDVETDCFVLLQGYACRYKATRTGGRQIVSFHVPGDVLNLQHMLLTRADHSLQAITEIHFATVSAADIKQITQERPALRDALWRDTLIDASVFREWVLNVGRRTAKARIAHMLCEFVTRREAAGLGSPEQYPLPMSPAQIADATGLTAVHVNRMLYDLARDGVIHRYKHEFAITDWPRLRQIAEFDATYLHAAA